MQRFVILMYHMVSEPKTAAEVTNLLCAICPKAGVLVTELSQVVSDLSQPKMRVITIR